MQLFANAYSSHGFSKLTNAVFHCSLPPLLHSFHDSIQKSLFHASFLCKICLRPSLFVSLLVSEFRNGVFVTCPYLHFLRCFSTFTSFLSTMLCVGRRPFKNPYKRFATFLPNLRLKHFIQFFLGVLCSYCSSVRAIADTKIHRQLLPNFAWRTYAARAYFLQTRAM